MSLSIPQRPAHDRPLAIVGWFVGTMLSYWLLCIWSDRFSPESGVASPVWLADGWALGLYFFSAGRSRIAVLAGIFAGNLLFAGASAGWGALLIGSAANVLQAWLAGTILEYLRDRSARWRGLPRAIAFFAVAVVGVNALAATIQAANASWHSVATFGAEFAPLFIADALGILALTPAMLTWSEDWVPRHGRLLRKRAVEAIFLLLTLLASTIWAYRLQPDLLGLTPPYFYLVVPVLLWGVVRFGSRGSTLGFAIYALLALYFTAKGTGPFMNGLAPVATGLLRLQEFLIVLGGTIVFTAAIVRERSALLRVRTDTERRYSEAMRASRNLIFEINYRDRRITWAGDTVDVLGIPAAAIGTTQSWTARVHPDDRTYLLARRDRLLAGEIDAVKLEYRVRRDDGIYIDIGVNAFVQLARGADGVRSERQVIGFVKDITERKREEADRRRLEAELRQAQKMEAIGQLAGGIAHDFNNILTSVVGYGELMQQRVAHDETLKRHVETILKAGERGRLLVSQILTFSRRSADERMAVALCDVIDEVVTLARGSSPHEIRFTRPPQLDSSVFGNPTALHQLFMNLATNGLQAMPAAGVLELSLSRVRLGADKTVMQAQLPAGEYLVTRVRDRGAGISRDTLARMFEPFFTTKPAGAGTGLGLSLAMSVAKTHGGGIDVETAEGAGTTFSVYLPAAGATGFAGADNLRGRDERILLVDDEAPLRQLAEEILVELGYQVASYASSEAALTAFARHPDQFDAVLSDEVMPGLCGTQLTTHLHALRADIPVVIITAYGGPGFELRAQQAGVLMVLKKPYQRHELADAFSRVFMHTGQH